MLAGFIGAALAGFVLTAIPNWTGGAPYAGVPLMLLVALFVAARLVLLPGSQLPTAAAAVIALLPLPAEPYRYAEWRKCRVAPDYHVELHGHFYSVPSALGRSHGVMSAELTGRARGPAGSAPLGAQRTCARAPAPDRDRPSRGSPTEAARPRPCR